MTRRGFWIAQLSWWGSYVVLVYFAALPTLVDSSFDSHVAYAAHKAAKAGFGLLASLVLYVFYTRWIPQWRLSALGAAALGASFSLGVCWELAARALYGKPLFDVELARAAIAPTFVLMAWSALYFTFLFRDRANAEAARALRATALATEAELAMLRYQVNPHFLFNSLNSLRALIDENPVAAREMVTQLAELFRYSLRTARDELTVDDEVTAIRNYFEIQKIRFEDGLDAAIDVDAAAAATPLAGFLVHPLVENAVKYGLETSERPLRIRVHVRRAGDRLEIEVTNTGRWIGAGAPHNGNGTGTGLRNVRARLAHLYPGRHTLELGEHDGVVRARLAIQLAVDPPSPAALAGAPGIAS